MPSVTCGWPASCAPEGALTVARLLETPAGTGRQFDDTPPREVDIAVLFW